MSGSDRSDNAKAPHPPGDEEVRQMVEQLVERATAAIKPHGPTPLAMYRIQFRAGTTFACVTEWISYLHELGVTHVYASPYVHARRGSPHGYDVCRHDEFNPELGRAEDFERFVAELRRHGMGHILDFVPNHMSASMQNPWWVDVLENGPNSPYANYFDIDWRPLKAELANKVLLPVLGEQYGESLESGKLTLAYMEGNVALRYCEELLPVGLKSVAPVLQHRLDELRAKLGAESEAFIEYESILTALHHLPPLTAAEPQQVLEGQRERQVIRRRLRELEQRSPVIAQFLEQNVAEFNGRPGEPSSFDRLDELIRAQAYRPCHWRAAADEVNYRRFFDINELAAICMENEEVFLRTHRLVLRLLAEGKLDGLRLDHVDGLYDPTQYLWRLQWAFLEQLGAAAFAEIFATSNECPAPRTWDHVRAFFLNEICRRMRLPSPSVIDWSGGQANHHENPPADAEPSAFTNLRKAQAVGSRQLPLYVVVEKILGEDEPLPSEWPVAGTSGYDFLNQLNGLFIYGKGLEEIHRVYSRFLGVSLDFWDEVHRCKLLILRVAMSSELQMLAHRLNLISEQHRRTRDFTLNSLVEALREIMASFPVYRTYPGPAGVSERDRRFIQLAVARAKRRNPAMESALFDFIRRVLLLEHPEGLPEASQREREVFTGRFQQVTSPVMAKGVEDTAFYAYCPLLSASEVGSHPPHAHVTVDQFHHENEVRHRLFPQAITTTSTHDTKRSEDVRARIDVLTEVPHLWRKAVNQWARINRRHLTDVDGEPAPSRNDEYAFYQTLIGMWPLENSPDDNLPQVIERLQLTMEKAIHEAKLRTSWINPNVHYDSAVRDFVAKTLESRKDNRFLKELRKFLDLVLDWGLYNGLSQVALKLASPGVPDIYQGQELWDFSMVDPDNRRPVDFDRRRSLLGELKEWVSREGPGGVSRALGHNPRDPRIKLWVTWQLLQLRRRFDRLFQDGEYVRLPGEGTRNEHLCAFAWRSRTDRPQLAPGPTGSAAASGQDQQTPVIVVVVPRLIARLDLDRPDREQSRYPLSAAAWGDTVVRMDGLERVTFNHLFTGETITAPADAARGSALRADQLFREFPIAVLTST